MVSNEHKRKIDLEKEQEREKQYHAYILQQKIYAEVKEKNDSLKSDALAVLTTLGISKNEALKKINIALENDSSIVNLEDLIKRSLTVSLSNS